MADNSSLKEQVLGVESPERDSTINANLDNYRDALVRENIPREKHGGEFLLTVEEAEQQLNELVDRLLPQQVAYEGQWWIPSEEFMRALLGIKNQLGKSYPDYINKYILFDSFPKIEIPGHMGKYMSINLIVEANPFAQPANERISEADKLQRFDQEVMPRMPALFQKLNQKIEQRKTAQGQYNARNSELRRDSLLRFLKGKWNARPWKRQTLDVFKAANEKI